VARANDILLYENPYTPNFAMNPKRHHSRRNPSIGKTVKGMFQGLDFVEMFAAIAGFALCAMVPGYIIKTSDTQLKKAGKVAIAVGFAVVAKMALNKYKPGIANAAMYGGIAGAGALALKEWAPGVNVINGSQPVRRIVGPTPVPGNVQPPMPAGGIGRTVHQEFTTSNAL
jgi:hypothetical protein